MSYSRANILANLGGPAARLTAKKKEPNLDRLRQEAWEILRHRTPTGVKQNSTLALMKRTTPVSGSQSGGSAEAEAGVSCGGDKTPPMKTLLLCLRRKAGACQTDINGELQVTGNRVAQWVNKLNVMEDKIKRREANQKKSRAHLEVVRRYAVDFTNLVEGHEEMLAELPWLMKQGRALTDRPISMNLQASKLTQQLMTVTQRAVTTEKAIQALEEERSALFVSVEGRCLVKLESICEEYSACLTYAPMRWALKRELFQKDGITPALARVNHCLEGLGLRLDLHFAPTRPSRRHTADR